VWILFLGEKHGLPQYKISGLSNKVTKIKGGSDIPKEMDNQREFFLKRVYSLWDNSNRKSLCIKWVTILLALFFHRRRLL
jgi:hypothetical protein